MNRATALLALLALAACGGGAGSAPETVAKGVDVEAELAALVRPETTPRPETFWANEGTAGTALWLRAVLTCCRATTFDRSAPFGNRRTETPPACEPIFRTIATGGSSKELGWQSRFDFMSTVSIAGTSEDPTAISDREALQALRSPTYDARLHSVAYWRHHLQRSTTLVGQAYAYCSSLPAHEGPRPNCVTLLRTVGDLTGGMFVASCSASWFVNDLSSK
ncbi:MAG: hypothetical protein F9K34_13835 [Albidovulum sp.]|uniref:hypothetical protein n=1 Tax=Albidovulum sp. TaxID=1872424 RepID=UPI00132C5E2C|nr:hypothetical protein [Defluviimonas sp.]KAB2882670.1 MAG: hypothetical protein F9K34_13835 [Defluviimonas sp.]